MSIASCARRSLLRLPRCTGWVVTADAPPSSKVSHLLQQPVVDGVVAFEVHRVVDVRVVDDRKAAPRRAASRRVPDGRSPTAGRRARAARRVGQTERGEISRTSCATFSRYCAIARGSPPNTSDWWSARPALDVAVLGDDAADHHQCGGSELETVGAEQRGRSPRRDRSGAHPTRSA